jgi:hypothetical protein
VTAADDQGSTARSALSRWLFLVPVGVLVVAVAIWWALGLRTPSRASGFGTTPVTFTFADTDLDDALAVIRPGVPVRFDGATPGFTITLKVTGMTEQDAMHWIGQLIDQQIELTDDAIVVRDIPWLERSHRAAAAWVGKTFQVRLWPDR